MPNVEATSGSYPDFVIYPTEDAFGGNFADVDGDGIDELALIKNVDINKFNSVTTRKEDTLEDWEDIEFVIGKVETNDMEGGNP